MAGVIRGNYPTGPIKRGVPLPPVPQANNQVGGGNPIANQYKLYNSAVGQQAEDYGDIMGGYRNLIASTKNNPTRINGGNIQGYTPQGQINPETVQAQRYSYNGTPDATASIKNLAELSKSGGYTDEGIRDLRARGISPIRSVYANAQRDMNRGRALQGGYSPNFNATQAKMAREMSEQLASQTTNVNAGIAENIAKGRLGIAGQYNSAAAHEADAMTAVNRDNAHSANTANLANAGNRNRANEFNVNSRNEAMKFNIGNQMDMLKMNEAMRSGDQNRIQQALQGMTSMYGTTPAMSKLFGDQAMQQSEAATRNKRQSEQDMLRAAKI